MVTGVEYAIGWNPLKTYFYPRSEQKLIVVHFVVKNRNSRDARYSAVSTKFTAVSQNNEKFAQATHYESRIAGRHEAFDATLKPGESQALYTAIVVNGNAKIKELLVDPQTTGPDSTSIQLSVDGQVAELPSIISENGMYQNDFDGVFKQTYRLSTADTSVSKFYTIGKLPARPDLQINNWGIVQVDFRNKHADSRRVFYDTYKPSRALTSTGRLVESQFMVTPDHTELIDLSLKYNESIQAAIAFPLANGETIQEVFLRERPARAADEFETSISIHYTLESDQNPLEKFLNQTKNQVFSGINRQPVFDSDSVPPGVYDPIRSWANFFADNGSVPKDALANTGPKDLTGAVLIPFFTPPPTILNRPEDKAAPQNSNPPKDNQIPKNANMAIRVKDLKIMQAQESTGDEPWVAILEFRGIPGKPESAQGTFIPATQCKTLGSNMKKDDSVNLSPQLGLREFKDIKPFEVIGVFVVAAEVDGGSASDRDSSALRMSKRLFDEWKATLSRANLAPLNDYSNANVRRQAQNLNIIYKNFLSTVSFHNDFSAPGTADNDEYAGRSAAMWMYLPGLTDGQAMAISQVPLIGKHDTLVENGYIPKGDWDLPLWHPTGNFSLVSWSSKISLYTISP